MDADGEIEWRVCPGPDAPLPTEGETKAGSLLRALAPGGPSRAVKTVVKRDDPGSHVMRVHQLRGSSMLAGVEGGGGVLRSLWMPARAVQAADDEPEPARWSSDGSVAGSSDLRRDKASNGVGPDAGDDEGGVEGGGEATGLLSGVGSATGAAATHEVTYDAGGPAVDTGRLAHGEWMRSDLGGAWWRREAVDVASEAGLLELSGATGRGAAGAHGSMLWAVGRPESSSTPALSAPVPTFGRPAMRLLTPSWTAALRPSAHARASSKRGAPAAFGPGRCAAVAAASSALPVLVFGPVLAASLVALLARPSAACPAQALGLLAWGLVFGAVGLAVGLARAVAVGAAAGGPTPAALETAVTISLLGHGSRMAMGLWGTVAVVGAVLALGLSGAVVRGAAACGGAIPVVGVAVAAVLYGVLCVLAVYGAVRELVVGAPARDDAEAKHFLASLWSVAGDSEMPAADAAGPGGLAPSLSRRQTPLPAVT